MSMTKKCVSVLLAVLTILTVMAVGVVPVTVKTDAASWNGYNYGGGKLYGDQTFLEAFGIDYDVYMKWLDDHDADSANPNYYLGTPYAHNDHRNPRGDCAGARGAYDSPGVAAMNCTGFVWHVLYKSAVNSGAPSYKINRLSVMGGVPASWNTYDVYRIWFDSVDDAYESGVLEKGDLMWLYGTSDNHNAIFYGDSPEDFIYWDSAGERNRYCEVHAIGESRGLWVAKAAQPNKIELQIDSSSGGNGTKFGTKYMIFDSKAKAMEVIDDPDNDDAWEARIGTIVLNSSGHGCYREQRAPSASELWNGTKPNTGHSYFSSDAERVSNKNTYYAVQWSHAPGISEDDSIHVFTYSGRRTGSGYKIYNFYAPIKVDTPAFSEVKSTSDGIRFKWNAVKDAKKYRIYYKNSKGSWTRMAETTSTSYLDTDVRVGNSYTYTIRCVDNYGNFISDFNRNGWRATFNRLDTPQITDLESTPEGVQITWDPVESTGDQPRYRVYYKNSSGGWTRMTETTDTTYVDDVVKKGASYTYTVRCVDQAGDFISKYNTNGWKHTYQGVATPQITEITGEATGVRIKWAPIEGVSKYRIYYKRADGSWSKVVDAPGTDTEFLDEVVTAGDTYTYNIRCINSKGYAVSDQSANGWKVSFNGVDTPEITELTSEAEGIRIKWAPVEGAVKYQVYYLGRTGWKPLEVTEGTEVLDTDVELGYNYTYTVRCLNAQGYKISDYNKAGWKIKHTGLAAPEAPTLENTEEGIIIRWNAVEGAAKYKVYYLGRAGWKQLEITEGTEVLDTDVEEGYHYTYTVQCLNSRNEPASDYDQTGTRIKFEIPAVPDDAPENNNPADQIIIAAE